MWIAASLSLAHTPLLCISSEEAAAIAHTSTHLYQRGDRIIFPNCTLQRHQLPSGTYSRGALLCASAPNRFSRMLNALPTVAAMQLSETPPRHAA